jgi:hypothetical protein
MDMANFLNQRCERNPHRQERISFQVLEHCIARLDVALFNALLRDPRIDDPTDPISDPLTEPSALPIPAGKLTFGGKRRLTVRTIRTSSASLPELLDLKTSTHGGIVQGYGR